jgi:hypothetical protein
MSLNRLWPGTNDKYQSDTTKENIEKALSFNYSQGFNFDWNNYQTIKESETKLPDIETFIDKISVMEKTMKVEENFQ